MPETAMLRVTRLTKTYPTAAGPLTVLHEASFELGAGASMAIVGPSGSGKTTLLGLCAGLDRAMAHLSEPELAAEDVRLAARALERIAGHLGVEDILDDLFARFCIGK